MFSHSRQFDDKCIAGLRQVSRQVSRRIKDGRNQQYCEKCIVIGLQSHKIVHKIVHEHVKI